MTEQIVPGTESMVGTWKIQVMERRSGPLGIFHHFVVQVFGRRYLGKSGSVVLHDLQLEHSYGSFEKADQAHTKVIEGLMRGGLEAAKERLREP